jgi:transposase
MARPKTIFTPELAQKAQADLSATKDEKIRKKLGAIISGVKFQINELAEILRVNPGTIRTWAKVYAQEGLDGLYHKPRRPKRSKLSIDQKNIVLSWMDSGKNSKGEATHWTLPKLRLAIQDEFGITLGINTIWVWLRKSGRKLKVSRPRHPKANPKAQDDDKKNR